MRYLKNTLNKNQTPQNLPIPGTNQVRNSAGGYVFAIDDWARLARFLILGSDGGSYYASERALTKENADAVLRCVQADGLRAVREIVAIADSARAPKHDPALFALAIAASAGDPATRKAALAAVPALCRTGTHLLHFAQFVDGMRGWGRGLREGVGLWYTTREPDALAYQAVKYQSRDGWSHRDVLRLAHPKAATPAHDAVLRWATAGTVSDDAPALIGAYEAAKRADSVDEIVGLIVSHDLPREAIPTRWLSERAVWDALLPKMPLTALLRNVATFTRVGVFADPERVALAVSALTDANRLRKARVHPIAVLSALTTYQSGHSVRGSGTWTPVKAIIGALDDAYYASFGAIEPTGKRWLLALDVSGSMGAGQIAGVPGLTPRAGSAAMAMAAARVETESEFVGFCETLTPLSISASDRLDEVVNTVSSRPFGGTDCAQPMLWAAKHQREFDVFVVYTDSETWAGNIHPTQALQKYRQSTGIAAKLIVVGMTASQFTIADPSDAGMLDIVGFDLAAPALMSDFARG